MIPSRDDLVRLLQSMHKTSTLGQVADAILQKFDSARAFSEIVKDAECWQEDEDGKKICPVCNQTLYWQKLTFKKRYAEAMRIIRASGKPLTFKEITDAANSILTGSPSEMAFKDTYFRYFTEARHWGFLEPTGIIRNRSEAYKLTQNGEEFLDGRIPADSFLLKLKGKDQVKRDGDADPLYVHQLTEDDPEELCDSAAHFNNSKPAL